jgi:hypothetical protein
VFLCSLLSIFGFTSTCPCFVAPFVIYICFMFRWASKHHDWVFMLLPVLWQALRLLINIYCWSPPTARGNEVSGYVMLADHSTCSCWRALNICICHFSVHWSSFFSVVFDFWSILFFAVGDGCWIWCNFQSSYLVISFWIQVDDKMYCIHKICMYKYGVWSGLEFQSLMLSVVMCPFEFDLLYVMSLSVNLIIMQLFCIYWVQ